MCSLIKKAEDGNCYYHSDFLLGSCRLIQGATKGADELSGNDLVQEELSKSKVEKREIEIFNALGGHVIGPTSSLTWLFKTVFRFNVISAGTLSELMQRVYESGMADLVAIVKLRPQNFKLTPRRIANTCFLVSLIKLGFLPLETLRPQLMSDSEWASLCARLGTWTGNVSLQEGLSDFQRSQLLLIVESSTCCSLHELQSDVISTMPARAFSSI
mmetsp:Transcript_34022/g.74463  ORF Transcript_34022/g.74463 Transcript_34022/m.74463 type:complete len:215 (+) Transcript_34022:2-646(+)